MRGPVFVKTRRRAYYTHTHTTPPITGYIPSLSSSVPLPLSLLSPPPTCTSHASCIPSWVLPIPGSPQNSMLSPTGTPPPSMRSMFAEKVMMLCLLSFALSRSSADVPVAAPGPFRVPPPIPPIPPVRGAREAAAEEEEEEEEEGKEDEDAEEEEEEADEEEEEAEDAEAEEDDEEEAASLA